MSGTRAPHVPHRAAQKVVAWTSWRLSTAMDTPYRDSVNDKAPGPKTWRWAQQPKLLGE